MLFAVTYSLLALFSTAIAAPARRTTCPGVITWDEAKAFSSSNGLTSWSFQDGTSGTTAVLSGTCPTTEATVTSFIVDLETCGPITPKFKIRSVSSVNNKYISSVVHQADDAFGTEFKCIAAIAGDDFKWWTMVNFDGTDPSTVKSKTGIRVVGV